MPGAGDEAAGGAVRCDEAQRMRGTMMRRAETLAQKRIVSDASNTIHSMETTGFEPATFALRTQRSPN